MRHLSITAALALAVMWLAVCTARAQQRAQAPGPPSIKASSAILVDVASGQVLYERNADARRPPASTTKIMTAILLMEQTQPDDVIEASARASETEGSSLHLFPGERISAGDLLYALMLRSANDGCVALAEHVAGTEPRFAELMTAKARDIGTSNTVFRNCNGLNDPPNETTARDLATMARYAMRFPQFNEVTRTRYYTVRRSIDQRDVILKNHAFKFLAHFPGADGVKTGYTVPAGHCFVGAATWNGWRLLAVVMHSPDSMGETAALLKYGFRSFETRTAAQKGAVVGAVPVSGGAAPRVSAVTSVPVQYVVRRGETAEVSLRPRLEPLTAPVAPGALAGAVELWLGDRRVASYTVAAAEGVPKAPAVLAHLGTGGWVLGAVLGSLVIGYGTAFAQGARGRGYRLSALLRGADRRR